MRGFGKWALIVAVAGSVTGCRFKGWESFTSATEPSPGGPAPVKGDPYGFGGIAVASGGLKPTTNYGAGSDPTSTAPVNPRLDQPDKGTGQNPGEYYDAGVGGYQHPNGPVFQGTPSDMAPDGAGAHG